MTDININNRINLTGNVKMLIVFFIICICVYLIVNDNWFQGLLVLNISLHYRDFIEFFTVGGV